MQKNAASYQQLLKENGVSHPVFMKNKLKEKFEYLARKHGLKSVSRDSMIYINQAAQHFYFLLINDLIKISRANNSSAYLSSKSSDACELSHIQSSNLLDKFKTHFSGASHKNQA